MKPLIYITNSSAVIALILTAILMLFQLVFLFNEHPNQVFNHLIFLLFLTGWTFIFYLLCAMLTGFFAWFLRQSPLISLQVSIVLGGLFGLLNLKFSEFYLVWVPNAYLFVGLGVFGGILVFYFQIAMVKKILAHKLNEHFD